jgi:hypothetical protein
MSVAGVWPQVLDFFSTSLVIEPSPGQLSGDAGPLPVRQFDQRIGLTRAFAEARVDPRDLDLAEQTFLEMARSRVYGILAGYEDQKDHDTLRSDPAFKLVAGRSPEDDDLASQPTLSRFENAISIKSLKRVRDVFIDQFIASFERPPRRLTFNLDAVDDRGRPTMSTPNAAKVKTAIRNSSATWQWSGWGQGDSVSPQPVLAEWVCPTGRRPLAGSRPTEGVYNPG